MSVPASQMWTVATYVLRQRVRGRRRYPLVLMLEPLFRCNLACAGCGKIQYPPHILKKELTPDQFHILRDIGCDVGQGYLFSRPLPASEAERMLRGTRVKQQRLLPRS